MRLDFEINEPFHNAENKYIKAKHFNELEVCQSKTGKVHKAIGAAVLALRKTLASRR